MHFPFVVMEAVEVLPHGSQRTHVSDMVNIMVLMTWRHKGPGHRQSRYRPGMLIIISIQSAPHTTMFRYMSECSISMVSCQKGPTRHAYTWQIGPFWQDTLDIWSLPLIPKLRLPAYNGDVSLLTISYHNLILAKENSTQKRSLSTKLTSHNCLQTDHHSSCWCLASQSLREVVRRMRRSLLSDESWKMQSWRYSLNFNPSMDRQLHPL